MKTIIISDLHNRVEWIEIFLSSIKYDKVIFLGDYFDDFWDTEKEIFIAANWLKQSLQKSNRIHLMGTHDIWYRFPYNNHLIASGNTPEKSHIINNILKKEDWEKLKLFYFEQDFFLTHARLHNDIINWKFRKNDICQKYNITDIKQFLNMVKFNTKYALSEVSSGYDNKWLSAGFARGGLQPKGGITWLDWDEEFDPIPYLNQIVGHTEHDMPQENHIKYSKNYCLDTKNKHIGILENGNFSWIENLYI